VGRIVKTGRESAGIGKCVYAVSLCLGKEKVGILIPLLKTYYVRADRP
jgi:hypothetical protein